MRFTIRDLLWLTALVAVACGGAVNYIEAGRRFVIQCDNAWQQIEISPPLLMGRDSVPPPW
jgi:hypothetical protein